MGLKIWRWCLYFFVGIASALWLLVIRSLQWIKKREKKKNGNTPTSVYYICYFIFVHWGCMYTLSLWHDRTSLPPLRPFHSMSMIHIHSYAYMFGFANGHSFFWVDYRFSLLPVALSLTRMPFEQRSILFPSPNSLCSSAALIVSLLSLPPSAPPSKTWPQVTW